MCREYTKDEVRDIFLNHVRGIVEQSAHGRIPDDCRNHFIERGQTETEYRVELAVFCVLSMLDGENGDIPKFIVAPDPHPEDKKYNIDNGEDWYPQTPHCENDIAGGLHELFHKKR